MRHALALKIVTFSMAQEVRRPAHVALQLNKGTGIQHITKSSQQAPQNT